MKSKIASSTAVNFFFLPLQYSRVYLYAAGEVLPLFFGLHLLPYFGQRLLHLPLGITVGFLILITAAAYVLSFWVLGLLYQSDSRSVALHSRKYIYPTKREIWTSWKKTFVRLKLVTVIFIPTIITLFFLGLNIGTSFSHYPAVAILFVFTYILVALYLNSLKWVIEQAKRSIASDTTATK